MSKSRDEDIRLLLEVIEELNNPRDDISPRDFTDLEDLAESWVDRVGGKLVKTYFCDTKKVTLTYEYIDQVNND